MKTNALAGRLVLGCFATVLLSGCGYVSPQRTAAKAIEKRLPSIIGPAQSYDVSVSGSDLGLARGHASEVHIHGVNVQITKALLLDDLVIDSHNLSFDRSTHTLTHADDTTATVSIGAENLSNYLYARHPKWSALQLSFVGQDISAQLPLEVLGQTTSVQVTGKFNPDPANPSDIDLHADSASVASVPLPASVVNTTLGRFNPIISLSGLKHPIQIQSTTINNGQLVIQGQVQLTQ